jgi:hypothetical protein
MATANTIESFFSLIKRPGRPLARAAEAGKSCLNLRPGEVIELPPGRHIRVVSGQLWLTHVGDPADHFPRGGDSFDTTKRSRSLIQALADSTLFIQ